MIKLSVIILSYNTKDITYDCIKHLYDSLCKFPSLQSEIIVVDNASSDGSQDMISQSKVRFSNTHIDFISIFNQYNEGFPKGNNAGLVNARGDYVLFLNSDVIIDTIDWVDIVSYLDKNENVGALSVRVELPTGNIDPASHRGFPTVWNSFSYYSKLEAITRSIPGLNSIFGGYHMTNLDIRTIHEVDAISGAFFMARADVLDKLQGFDDTFFMYGEDIDLAYRMKEHKYSIVYYPKYSVTHLKYQSGLKKGQKGTEDQTKKYFHDAMRIFYRKHYQKKNPWFINQIVYFFIDLKSQI